MQLRDELDIELVEREAEELEKKDAKLEEEKLEDEELENCVARPLHAEAKA